MFDERFRHFHWSNRVCLQNETEQVVIDGSEYLVAWRGIYTGIVQQNIDRGTLVFVGQRIDHIVVRHIQLFDDDVREFLCQRMQCQCFIRTPTGSDDCPTPLCILPGKFQPDTAVGSGN